MYPDEKNGSIDCEVSLFCNIYSELQCDIFNAKMTYESIVVHMQLTQQEELVDQDLIMNQNKPGNKI